MEEVRSETKETAKVYDLYFWLYAVILLTGFFLRWAALGDKPVHHDESLHLMYGRYFYDWPEYHFYRYSAMLHGPLLYNVLRFVYLTLGSTTWAGRSLVAILGTLMMFAPLLFRRYFTRNGLLALTAAVALSPTLIYWSRFIREDNLQLSAMLIILIGVTLVKDGLKVFVTFIGLTLMFCVKENSFVTVAMLAGYLIFESVFNRAVHGSYEGLLTRLLSYLGRYRKETIAAVLLGVLLYSFLYSAGFRYRTDELGYLQGVLDGLYRESIFYWLNQHSIERISGPFLFHFYVLSWYELAFALLMLVQFVLFYKRAGFPIRLAGLLMLVFAVYCLSLALAGVDLRNYMLFKPLRLKEPLGLEAVGAVIFFIQPFIVTCEHLLRKEKALAFWGYLFTASLFTYSYLGEKVPWLTVYPFVPGLIYFVLFFERYFAERAPLTVDGKKVDWLAVYPWWKVLVTVGLTFVALSLLFALQDGAFYKEKEFDNRLILGMGVLFIGLAVYEFYNRLLNVLNLKALALIAFLIFNLRAAVLTNFVYAGRSNEYISQVHTTVDFHRFILKLREEITNPLSGIAPKVLGIEDSVWPVTWYMVDVPQYKFDAPENERSTFDYMIKNWKEGEAAPAGFRAWRLSLRGWWVPDFSKITLKRYLNYALNHLPWSDPGYSYVTVLVKDKQPQAAPEAATPAPEAK